MKLKREIKVKVTALKTEKLCLQCKYGWKNNKCNFKNCYSCEMFGPRCKCLYVKEKQPCPYFERANKQEA